MEPRWNRSATMVSENGTTVYITLTNKDDFDRIDAPANEHPKHRSKVMSAEREVIVIFRWEKQR